MPLNLNQKVFFYTTSQEGPPEGAYFQDLIIDLAEGFNQLGIQHFASSNYWRLFPGENEWLLKFNPDVQHQDCDIVVLERQWIEENKALPTDLFNPSRQYITVYLDCLDGVRTTSYLPEFRRFDFIFKTHCTRRISRFSNIHPWAFGLSNRVLEELSDFVPYQEKKKCILANFREKKFSHSLRKFVQKNFIPEIQSFLPIDPSTESISNPPQNPYHYLRWSQTGRRHYPSYYNRLKESAACACFGGFFLGPPFTDYNGKLSYYSILVLSRLGLKTDRIAQWDSWRFWESLAAGCVAFHVDFDKYGFELPVMPRNWEHYIGIDLDNVQDSIDRIAAEPWILETIASQGRNWALTHYSPLAVALRFMEKVSGS